MLDPIETLLFFAKNERDGNFKLLIFSPPEKRAVIGFSRQVDLTRGLARASRNGVNQRFMVTGEKSKEALPVASSVTHFTEIVGARDIRRPRGPPSTAVHRANYTS